MARIWCGNFDRGAGKDECEVLQHGLRINSWVMQYQYEHGGYEYQGNLRQKARTTEALNSMCDVHIGDTLVAYLKGSMFFAIGRVVEPRKLSCLPASKLQVDSIKRTTAKNEKCHQYLSGLVKYRDAPAFYDDFTDKWHLDTKHHGPDAPPFLPYAQRIDIDEWKYEVEGGVVVHGLADVVAFPRYRQPLFEIRDKKFFKRIENALRVGIDR